MRTLSVLKQYSYLLLISRQAEDTCFWVKEEMLVETEADLFIP